VEAAKFKLASEESTGSFVRGIVSIRIKKKKTTRMCAFGAKIVFGAPKAFHFLWSDIQLLLETSVESWTGLFGPWLRALEDVTIGASSTDLR
jgi:hypothetical protein